MFKVMEKSGSSKLQEMTCVDLLHTIDYHTCNTPVSFGNGHMLFPLTDRFPSKLQI